MPFSDDKQEIINLKKKLKDRLLHPGGEEKGDVTFEMAFEKCETLLRKYPEKAAEIQQLYAEIYAEKGDFKKALQRLEIVRINGVTYDYFITLGKICRDDGGKVLDAATAFLAAISIHPTSFAYLLLGETYAMDKDFANEAETNLLTAIQLKQGDKSNWYAYAKFLNDQGRYFEASRALATALSSPDFQPIGAKALELGLNHILSVEAKTPFDITKLCKASQKDIDKLFEYVRTGSVGGVLQLLNDKMKKIDPTVRNAQGNMLIHEAVLNGNYELIEPLTHCGNYIDALNHENQTPIVIAVIKGYESCLHALRGANMSQLWNNFNLLQLAVVNNRVPIVRSLILDQTLLGLCGGQVGLLHFAIVQQKTDVVKFICEENNDLVNMIFNEKKALHVALDVREDPPYNIIKTLLCYTQEVDKKDANVPSPLEYAKSIRAPRPIPSAVINLLQNVMDRKFNIVPANADVQANIKKINDSLNTALTTVLVKGKLNQFHLIERYKDPVPAAPDNESLAKQRRDEILKLIQGLIINHPFWGPRILNPKLTPQQFNEMFSPLIGRLKVFLTSPAYKVIHASSTTMRRVKIYQFNPQFLTRTVKDIFATAQEQLLEAERQTQAVNKALSDAAQFKAQQEAKKNPDELSHHAKLFRDRLIQRFSEVYFFLFTIHSKQAVQAEDKEDLALKAVSAAAKQSNTKIGLPTTSVEIPVSALVTVGISAYQWAKKHSRENRARLMANLFTNINEEERITFLKDAANAVIKRFEAQIDFLEESSRGLELFADCIVERIIQYICKKESNTIASKESILSRLERFFAGFLLDKNLGRIETLKKDLSQIFVHAIVRMQLDSDLEKVPVRTLKMELNENQWTILGILESSGVMVIRQNGTVDYYEHPTRTNVKKYGFCLVPEADADDEIARRDLQPISPEEQREKIAGARFAPERAQILARADARAGQVLELMGQMQLNESKESAAAAVADSRENAELQFRTQFAQVQQSAASARGLRGPVPTSAATSTLTVPAIGAQSAPSHTFFVGSSSISGLSGSSSSGARPGSKTSTPSTTGRKLF